jgi:UDP-N-acetylglucosamine:LPS N-acetylglucosamine transferase
MSYIHPGSSIRQERQLPDCFTPKILIFTSKTGGGHISLAEALRDRLEDRYNVEIIDPQPRIIHWHYRMVSRHALWLWATEFRLSDHPLPSRSAHRVYDTLLSRYVQATLEKTRPNLVITTYPFLTTEVTFAMRRMKKKIPFVMLFSDPNGVHHSWLTEQGADAVFAPTRETHEQALMAGFDVERVHLSGWPVRSQFYPNSHISRAEQLAQMNLDPKRFTIFLQGGGEGAAKFVRTIENLMRIDNVQIILAAGTNKRLYHQFKNTSGLFALPFTKEIASYIAAADIVMGKAGPNMLFEAVSMGKPFVATAYIPGQEQANLEFIRRHHLGWVALNAHSQRELIEDLIAHPGHLRGIQAKVEEYAQWNMQRLETIGPVIDRLI